MWLASWIQSCSFIMYFFAWLAFGCPEFLRIQWTQLFKLVHIFFFIVRCWCCCYAPHNTLIELRCEWKLNFKWHLKSQITRNKHTTFSFNSEKSNVTKKYFNDPIKTAIKSQNKTVCSFTLIENDVRFCSSFLRCCFCCCFSTNILKNSIWCFVEPYARHFVSSVQNEMKHKSNLYKQIQNICVKTKHNDNHFDKDIYHL